MSWDANGSPIDKAGFWLYADEDLPDPFTLADMLRLRPERADIIAWMRAHCGDREVYILNDIDECFPPHSTGNFPWGVDGRVTGWRVYQEDHPEGVAMNKEELEEQAARLKAQARAAEEAVRLLELKTRPLDVSFDGKFLTFRGVGMPATHIQLTSSEADVLGVRLFAILCSAADAQIAVVSGSDR